MEVIMNIVQKLALIITLTLSASQVYSAAVELQQAPAGLAAQKQAADNKLRLELHHTRATLSAQAKTTLCPSNRPAAVQSAIDKSFERKKKILAKDWGFGGRPHYYLLGFQDDGLLKTLALRNPAKKDVYIMDVGCGNGQWGKNAQSVLRDSTIKKTGKHFHILSITGGIECDDKVERSDNVTLYQLSQFKIENIDEELTKRGFDLKGKIDLMVSSWTLQHLVDPFGTLQQMYALLAPAHGMLLATGFRFQFNSDRAQRFPKKNESLLAHNAITPLFFDNILMGTLGDFLLMRNDEQELVLPLGYGEPSDCEYPVATVYTKEDLAPLAIEKDQSDKETSHYWHKNNKRAKELFLSLKHTSMEAHRAARYYPSFSVRNILGGLALLAGGAKLAQLYFYRQAPQPAAAAAQAARDTQKPHEQPRSKL
jgi:hypothetical protein